MRKLAIGALKYTQATYMSLASSIAHKAPRDNISAYIRSLDMKDEGRTRNLHYFMGQVFLPDAIVSHDHKSDEAKRVNGQGRIEQ